MLKLWLAKHAPSQRDAAGAGVEQAQWVPSGSSRVTLGTGGNKKELGNSRRGFSLVPGLGRAGGDPDLGMERQPRVAGCQEVAGAGWGNPSIDAFPDKQLLSNHS